MARKKKETEDIKLTSKSATENKVSSKKVEENWADKPDSDIYEKCTHMYDKIVKAYKNREEADEAIKEYWNIYNAIPDDNQIYQGVGKCYVPVVRDCINARAKRALRQNFPNKYKHVDAVGTDGDVPYQQLSLLEHYIRATKLKSLMRSVYVAGDVTGQLSVYIDWLRDIRSVTNMVKKNPILQTVQGEDLGLEDTNEEEEVEQDSETVEERPDITDFAVEDLAVIPPTCNSIEKAELVCIKLRMSKSQVEQMVDDGVFILPEDSELSDWMDEHKGKEKKNPPKDRTSDAGVKTEGTNKYALIYEVTARIEFEKGKKSLAYIYFAGENEIVGIIKAPQWGQKRPIISIPVDRLAGSFYGISKIEAVKWLQWNLNDRWNMGQDSSLYSLLPIVMTNPEKNPNYASMVYGLGAVWPTSPQDTQFAEFPQLWKESIGLCQSIKAQIYESMDCNDMMMGKAPSGRKNAQAVGAQMQEQSIPIMDHAEYVEEEMLNPLIERFFEYDCQFREKDLTVITMGPIGVKSKMQQIPPQEWGNRYTWSWVGTDYVQNMQRMQQQISTMNVLRGIPPQQLGGKKLDITPILEVLVQNVFGAELGQRILVDERNMYSVSPDIEDEMMLNNIPAEIHEADNDLEHIQEHQKTAALSKDPTGMFRMHIQKHMMQLQQKRQTAMGQQQQQGMPGVPGGAGPGVAGTPRMGAQVSGPQGMQQPNGAIHPDAMAGGVGRG